MGGWGDERGVDHGRGRGEDEINGRIKCTVKEGGESETSYIIMLHYAKFSNIN